MSTTIPKNEAPFSLRDVARHTSGTKHGDAQTVGVCTDTRAVAPRNLFVALVGERFDAHDFLDVAVAAGASALVVSDAARVPAGIPYVLVPDTLRALGDLARAHRDAWGRTLVAITGSAGKTTTKNLTAAGLRAAGKRVLATEGNLNNRIGAPMTLFGLGEAHELAVIEIGTSERGEIARLAEICGPDVGVVTRVAVAHAAGLGSLEDVAYEKGALFRALPERATAIPNADDPQVLAASGGARCRVVRYGHAEAAEVRVVSSVLSPAGTDARFVIDGRERSAHLALVGETAASNAAAALAVAHVLGVDVDAALSGIAAHSAGPGRMCLREGRKGALVVDDAYNANPSSMEAAIRSGAAFAASRGGRLLLVLGDMKELGAAQLVEHQRIGRLAIDVGCAMLVAVGDAMRAAASEARQGGITVAETRDASTAADLARDLVAEKDVVVVKGSRSMGMERVVDALVAAEEPA